MQTSLPSTNKHAMVKISDIISPHSDVWCEHELKILACIIIFIEL